MKKTAFLIMAVSVAAWLPAQHLLTKDKKEVQQTVIDFFESLSNRDSVDLKNYFTADLVLFEYGSIWNADTLIRKAITLNTAADFKRINTIDFISTKVNKNSAWAAYYLRSEITRNGKQSTVLWIETMVLIKERRRWKIKVLHSTLVKRN